MQLFLLCVKYSLLFYWQTVYFVVFFVTMVKMFTLFLQHHSNLVGQAGITDVAVASG